MQASGCFVAGDFEISTFGVIINPPLWQQNTINTMLTRNQARVGK